MVHFDPTVVNYPSAEVSVFSGAEGAHYLDSVSWFRLSSNFQCFFGEVTVVC